MNKMRWKYGDTNPVLAEPNPESEIELGDIVYFDDYAYPASEGFYRGDFLGVALQRSAKGNTAKIRVGTTGVYEFDIAEDKYQLGTKVRPAIRDGVQNQEVEDANHCAIGKVVTTTEGNSVNVCIYSEIMGAPNNVL